MSNAVVLLSGGQDSTTCLYWAKQNFDNVIAVSIFYGQRHAEELARARKIAELAGVQLIEHATPILSELGGSALVEAGKKIEASGGYGDSEAAGGLPTSFVPGRNILFLTIASAIAVKVGAKNIVTGVCQTDYSGYPDCRRSFVDALETAVSLGMPSECGPLRMITPLMYLTKRETVLLANRLPGCFEALAHSMTCYEGQSPACGECPACTLRAAGFAEAGLPDPAAEGAQ